LYKCKNTILLTLTMIFVSTFSLSGQSYAQKTITLGGSLNLKNSFYGRWSHLIYSEAFERLGYKFVYKGYPTARLAVESKIGRIDGEINRVASYAELRPNLIRVEESHFSTRNIAFASRPGIKVDNWHSLLNTNYKVEYRRGSKIYEKYLTKYVSAENLSDITSSEQGLKRLLLGRIDIFTELDHPAREILESLDPLLYPIAHIYQAGVLGSYPSYVYLHTHHQKLAQQLSVTLIKMKQEGLIEKYKSRLMKKTSQ